MVMETPSPQCVGREFVRQYYTLLNEAPMYLHRFYSHNSSFVHGGVEKPGEEHPPVMGQTNIHQKILSLKFNDCHAKIRQVDSQATVGNAVVVQVTGELSNNGQPMRRFMQTFVLVPQTPKKYYVHNDIFRYQDEVFQDAETDASEETVQNEMDGMVDESAQPLAGAPTEVQDPTVTSYYEPQPPQQQAPQQQAPPPISNGNAHLEEVPEPEPLDEPVDVPEEEPAVPEMDSPAAPAPATTESADLAFEPEKEKSPEPAETREASVQEDGETEEPTAQEVAQPAKTCSWAAVIASKATAPSAPPAAPKMAPAPVAAASKPADAANPQPQRTQRPPRNDRPPRENARPMSNTDFSAEDSRRPRFPDSHQLFVGNLPHSITEKELKAYFETYGNVMEVRIKGKGTRDVPNFSFVVFDNAESAQQVLSARPLTIRGEHRLNVEEKKQRGEQGTRPGSGTRAPGGRGGSMGRPGGPPGLAPRGGPGRGGPPERRGEPRAPNMGGPPGGRGGFMPRR